MVNHHIERGRAAAPNIQTSRRRVLAVDHGHKGLGHRLPHRQQVLKARTSALITILHQQAILLPLVDVHTADRITQMPIKRVDPVAEIIKLLHAISLVVQHH
jgi:hypothetical protein